MKPLKEYDKESILSKELFEEIFEQEDLIQRSLIIADLSVRAKELKVKTQFETIIKTYEKVLKQIERNEKVDRYTHSSGRMTDFAIPIDSRYSNMRCGSWFATEDGIYSLNVMGLEQRASRQPILPVDRLENMETGEERLTLAFKKNHRWKEITVGKDIVASASKIVTLAKFGLSVTSENAKYLVKYLNDIESLNDDDIPLTLSSTKLGWHGDDFLPYESDIVFDGDKQFKHVYESIREHGSKRKWLNHVKEVRKTGRIEAKFMLASSFASVLIKPLGALPFIIDLWGQTEGGKSVSLMLACSVWADPDESQYIGDFKSTDVQLEVRADLLNHLPLMLDDTSKTSSRIRDNFEGVVYDLCSGKGKSRSDKDLGIRKENRWRNCILTNGERPLQSYVNQGGALNRILEVECEANVYKDVQKTITILKQNYGFAGKCFIDVIKEIGIDEIKAIYQNFYTQISKDEEKMQKQSMSLAIILTADKIATDHIFKDDCYIPLDEAKKVLIDRNTLSDNERCYRYLLDKIAMNSSRFDGISNIEQWGTIDNGYVYFYTQAFEDLCKNEGYSKKSFLSWADKKALILTDSGRNTKVKRITGKLYRCIALKVEETDEDGFASVEDIPEQIPFEN